MLTSAQSTQPAETGDANVGAGGLTSTRKFLAVIVGIVITRSYVFVTAPHPVETPKFVITPVPTPAPVVITEQPTPVPVTGQITLSPVWQKTMLEMDLQMAMTFQFMQAFMVSMLIFFPLIFVLRRIL